MKILIGLVAPDQVGSRSTVGRWRSPTRNDAARLGIGMVHQHFSLVDELLVWENVVLGEQGRLDRVAARRLVGEIGERYGLGLDPDARVGDLTAGLRQRVEIIKCLRRDPDDRASSTSRRRCSRRRSPSSCSRCCASSCERQDKAVALVSHKLDEILHATDVVTILRDGRVVDAMATRRRRCPLAGPGDGGPAGVVARRGDARSASSPRTRRACRPPASSPRSPIVHVEPPVLRIIDAVVTPPRPDAARPPSLDVRAGEIVGVAGVEGNGQAELVDVLGSLLHLDAGSRRGRRRHACRRVAPGRWRAAGIALIPEDRHDSGCVLDLTVAENLFLGELGPRARAGRRRPRQRRRRQGRTS